MPYHFRHAICNEVFEGWRFPDTCRAIKKAGYQGIEIAPFTLNEFPATITPAERSEYRRVMNQEGLEFIGLHWLLVSPKGLHVTTPDTALRKKSWQHVRDLVDLCADLAGDDPSPRILVFGSPKQRTSTGGISAAEATRNFVDGLSGVGAHAAERGVTILVESLPKSDSDIINTVADAVAIVEELNSPGVETMFDTHNAADETEPHEVVLERHLERIRHVHVNERDGRQPSTGDYPFRPVLEVLARRQFPGWVSLEVFDFKEGAESIATSSRNYLESIIRTL